MFSQEFRRQPTQRGGARRQPPLHPAGAPPNWKQKQENEMESMLAIVGVLLALLILTIGLALLANSETQ
jgi:hypothetical protein